MEVIGTPPLLPGGGNNIDEILQLAMQPPPNKGPSAFRQILGGVVGGAANMFMPGAGGAISKLIAGSGAGGNNIMGNSAAYLQFQQQAEQQMIAFTMVSTILKCQHDAAMSAIQNAKSNG